jgi:hypothetical protein
MLFNLPTHNFLLRSRLQLSMGVKALYGPLTANNQPQQHPELFEFPANIQALNQTPYMEMHIGLNRILKLFRVEWIQGMTYTNRGMLLLGMSF